MTTEPVADPSPEMESPAVTALRQRLWDACEDCPACGGGESDNANTDDLEEWLAGAEPPESPNWPAWHLDSTWRALANPIPPDREPIQ